jgi:hypothetical protein
MAAFMLGCVAGGNVLLILDDPTTWTDEGVAYDAFAVTNPVNFGKTAPSGRLRRVSQAVTLGAPATVTITPLGDGDEYEDQATSEPLDPSGGSTQIVEAEVAVDAQRFQYRVAVSAFDGLVQFGEADLDMIPKRSGK